MSEVYLLVRNDYEESERFAIVTRQEDAEALAELHDCSVEPWTVDDPTILRRLYSGVWVWKVSLRANPTPDLLDRASLAGMDADVEPMIPVGGGFVGYIEAASREAAIAKGWAEVRARGLSALPMPPIPFGLRMFPDFEQYLNSYETPFLAKGRAIEQKTLEWESGKVGEDT